MKHKKIKLVAGLLLCTGITSLHAQENINTASNNYSGSGGSVSYSIGQVIFQTHTGTSGTIAEGVQQPFEILVLTGYEETKGINLSVAVYPNPSDDYLILNIGDFEISGLSFQLYEINGKLLQTQNIAIAETIIDLSNLEPVTYLLKVLKGNKELRTFKVIKK